MKFKIPLIILIIFLFTSLISGCITKTNNDVVKPMLKDGFGVVGDSQFELESSWSQRPITGNGYIANFKFNKTDSKNVIFMRVTQFNEKSKFDEDIRITNKSTSTWSILSSTTENIEGVNVKTIKLSRKDDTETVKYYFFERNGKYYKVLIDIGGTTGAQSYFESNKYLADSTLKKIIRTIH